MKKAIGLSSKAWRWVVAGTGAFVLGVWAAGVGAQPSARGSLGEMAASAAGDLAQVPQLVAILFYVAGVVFVGAGLIKLKKHSDTGTRDHGIGGALMALAVGVALIAAPTVYQGIASTFGVDDTATIERPTL